MMNRRQFNKKLTFFLSTYFINFNCSSRTVLPKKRIVTPEKSGFSTSRNYSIDEFQNFVNTAARNNERIDWGDESNIWNFDSALMVPSHSDWIAKGAVFCNTHQNADSIRSAVLHPGNYHPAYFDKLVRIYPKTIGQQTSGIISIRYSDIDEHALKLSAGDLVWIFSDNYYEINKGHVPFYLDIGELFKNDTVEKILFIKVPFIDYNIGSIASTNTQDNIEDNLGNSLYVCRNSKISGLNLFSENGSAVQRGGTYLCDFSFRSMTAKNCAYLNSLFQTRLKVNKISAFRKILDIAGASSNFKIEVDEAVYIKNKKSSPINLVTIGESSRKGNIIINKLKADDFDYKRSIFSYNNVNDCEIYAKCVTARNCKGIGVSFNAHRKNDSRNTQPSTSGNIFSCERFYLGDNYIAAIRFRSEIEDIYFKDNKVIDGEFKNGRFSNGYAVSYADPSSKIYPEVKIENKNIFYNILENLNFNTKKSN